MCGQDRERWGSLDRFIEGDTSALFSLLFSLFLGLLPLSCWWFGRGFEGRFDVRLERRFGCELWQMLGCWLGRGPLGKAERCGQCEGEEHDREEVKRYPARRHGGRLRPSHKPVSPATMSRSLCGKEEALRNKKKSSSAPNF